jgi:hypothetical protein
VKLWLKDGRQPVISERDGDSVGGNDISCDNDNT